MYTLLYCLLPLYFALHLQPILLFSDVHGWWSFEFASSMLDRSDFAINFIVNTVLLGLIAQLVKLVGKSDKARIYWLAGSQVPSIIANTIDYDRENRPVGKTFPI